MVSHQGLTLRLRQDGRHFPDDIFTYIFLNENIWILIKISMKLVPKGPINSIPALAQIIAWWRPGDKSLSEPIMVGLLTYICGTQPQWINLELQENCISTCANFMGYIVHMRKYLILSSSMCQQVERWLKSQTLCRRMVSGMVSGWVTWVTVGRIDRQTGHLKT